MEMTVADRIVEWEAEDGSRNSLLVVRDESIPEDDVDHKWLEIITYDPTKDRWVTDQELGYINEVTDVSLPPGLES